MCILCEATADEMAEYGKIFGYPECCISEYVKDTIYMNKTGIDVRNEAQIKIARETHGFVPCKKHAKLIKKGKVSLEDLVGKNRDHEKSKKLNKMAEI